MTLNRLLLALATLGVALAPWCNGHEDVVNGMRGVERITDPIQAQGRNKSQDRAYGLWAQYEDNQTDILERPMGKRWITVAESIVFVKKVWGVNVLDETGDPEVAKIKFALAIGPIDRQFALPTFLSALSMAVSQRCERCYVEQDEKGQDWSFNINNHNRGTVHIRKARPLQADHDHPCDVDAVLIKKLEDSLAGDPSLDKAHSAPEGQEDKWCIECNNRVAALPKNADAAAVATIAKSCAHCSRYWQGKDAKKDPIVKGGSSAPVAAPKKDAPAPK